MKDKQTKIQNTIVPIIVIAFVIGAIGLLVYMQINAMRDFVIDRRLRAEGQTVTAEVLALEQRGGGSRSSPYCHVEFSYPTDDGRTLTRETDVGNDFCQIFRAGSEVDAFVMADEPTVADLAWGGYVELNFFLLLLLDGLIVVLSIGAIIGTRMNRRIREDLSAEMDLTNPRFPLVVKPPRGSQLGDIGCILPFGLLVTVMMGGAMIYAIVAWPELDRGLPPVLLCSAAPFLAFGIAMIHLSIKDFYRSFTFTAQKIDIRHMLWGSKIYAAEQFTKVAVEERSGKNNRKSYHLMVYFDDESVVEIFSSTLDDADKGPVAHLQDMALYLRKLYGIKP